jgi:hypothetical protein
MTAMAARAEARKPARRPRGRRVPIAELRARILELYARRTYHSETPRRVRRVFRLLVEVLGVEWVDELEDPVTIRRFDEALPHESDNTRRVGLSIFQTILYRGREMGLLASVPEFPAIVKVHRFPKGARSTAPSPRGVRRLMDHLKSESDDWKVHRLYALVALVVLAGIGLAQALRLRVADIDLAGGTIRMPGSRTRISSSPDRPVRIPPELKAILAGWIPRTECQWVLPGWMRTGPWNKLGRNNPLVSLKAAARAARIAEAMSFEKLRRYYAENAVLIPTGLEAPNTRPESATSSRRPSHTLRLGEPQETTWIDDVPVKALSISQHAIVKAVAAAGRRGLTEGEIRDKSGHGGAPTTLRRLRDSHAKWAEIIRFPGIPHGRIRIDARLES